MAQIKYSALVSEIKGKLNGSIFQRSKSSGILRNNLFVKKSSSRWQQLRRNQLATVSGMWRELTDIERQNWISLDNQEISGFLLFCSINFNLLTIGKPVNRTAPIKPIFPLINMTEQFSIINSNGTFTLSFFRDQPVNEDDFTYILFMSSSQSLGVSSNRAAMALLGQANIIQVPRVIWADFAVPPNRFIAPGLQIYVEVYMVHNASGYKTQVYSNFTTL